MEKQFFTLIVINSYKNYYLEIIFEDDGCIMSLLSDTKVIREHSFKLTKKNNLSQIVYSFSLKYDKFHF